MNLKYNIGDQVYLMDKDSVVNKIKTKICNRQPIDMEEFFEAIKMFFITKIEIQKDSINYFVNENPNFEYYSCIAFYENKLYANIEDAKNEIKEIVLRELEEFQEFLNKSLKQK